MAKVIKVKCKAAGELSIDLLEVIQGDLKELSSESLKKLKNSIIRNGFSFPIFVWENPEDAKLCVLDGTQRIKALKSLKDDGYKIPQIPISFIEADDLDHAKSKLAAAASTYGEFTEHGVKSFFDSFKIDTSLFETIKMPHLDFKIQETTTVQEHERLLSEEVVDLTDNVDFSDRCPHCGESL